MSDCDCPTLSACCVKLPEILAAAELISSKDSELRRELLDMRRSNIKLSNANRDLRAQFQDISNQTGPRLTKMRDERDALALRLDAQNKTLEVTALNLRQYGDEVERLQSRLSSALDTLAYLEARVFENKWDGTIGLAPRWSMAGPYRHELAKWQGHTLIEAIQPFLVERPAQKSDACPLCGRTDAHSHTSGPFGMS